MLLPARPGAVEPSVARPADFTLSPELECFGNFETAGVLAPLPQGIPSDRIGRVVCALNVEGRWKPVHDLVQVGSSPWFAGSLFWLKPDSRYQVAVVVLDKAGKAVARWWGEAVTRAEPALPPTACTLYVATDGNDANAGTLAQPLRTVARAFATAAPGTTIVLRQGTYYEGDLTFANRASAAEPIVVRAHPGEQVALDASHPDLLAASAWQPGGDGLYRHDFEGKCYNVTLEDRQTGELTRLMPLFTVEELRARSVKNHGDFAKLGIRGAFCCDGTTAYLLPPRPLENYVVHIARHTKGIVLENQGHVFFDGIEIRFFGKDDFSAAAMVYNSPDVCFQNCRIVFCDTGIWVKMASHRVTIQDCVFLDGISDWPFGMLKTGGAAASFEAGAVYVDAKFSGRGLVIRRNRIEGLFDGVHLTPWIEDDARSNEVDFYGNVVLDCVDDFMEVDGFARNVRIFDNYMRRSLTGVSLAQALDGPTFVIYNVIADCGMVRAATHEENYGYPFKTNGGPQEDIGSGPIFFYHNTAYTLDPNSRAMLVKRPVWKKITLRNNIWYGRKLGFELWTEQPSPMDFDYDNLYAADTNAPLVLKAYHTQYRTLDEVRQKLKYLPHGLSAEPRLTDPAQGVYTLLADSPCVNAGTLVAGINEQRMRGAAPDLGAYERQ
jgi:hypothetical protein